MVTLLVRHVQQSCSLSDRRASGHAVKPDLSLPVLCCVPTVKGGAAPRRTVAPIDRKPLSHQTNGDRKQSLCVCVGGGGRRPQMVGELSNYLQTLKDNS